MNKVPKVKTFPQLIRWLADEYHEGAVLPIANKVGVSPALVGLWSRGQTAEPRALNLQRLAEVYNLDFLWVLGLVHGKRLLPIGGGSDHPAAPPVNPAVGMLDTLSAAMSLIRRGVRKPWGGRSCWATRLLAVDVSLLCAT